MISLAIFKAKAKKEDRKYILLELLNSKSDFL